MIFHDIKQNSDEWDKIRVGKVTTSKFGVFMANYGKAFGEPAKKYAHKLAYEQITGEKYDEERYSNDYMDAGHEWEPIANKEYQSKTFYEVLNGGFCESEKYDNVGGSPDGIIKGFNGGIEIKSVIQWTQRNTIKRGSFDPAYRWQLLGNIWLCGWDWCDFISYGYKSTENTKLFIDRLDSNCFVEEINKIEPRLEDFLELIETEKKYI